MKNDISNPKIKSSLLFLIYFLTPVIVFTIYLLAYFPGILPNDSISQWKQITRFSFGDWHPVFHTFFEWVVTRVWLSPAMIAIVQILMFSFAYASGIYQFDKMGINRKLLIALTLIFAFNPVNGAFSITILKDTPFISSVVFLTVLLIKVYHTQGTWLSPIGNKILLVITLVFVSLFRHNGLAPALASAFFLLILYRKYWRDILIVVIAALILICAIKGPLYNALDVKPSNSFQPLVLSVIQVSAVAHFDGDVTLEEKEFLSQIATWEDWKNGYDKYSVLGVTKTPSYNLQKFGELKSDFLKIWIKLVLKNPKIALKAYLERTNMIWKITTPSDAKLQVPNIVIKNKVGLKRESILPQVKEVTDFFCKAAAYYLFDWLLLRPAIYMYFIFLICFLIIMRKKFKPLLVFVPVLANTLGLALITTSSQPRYYYATILIAPFALFMYMYVKRISTTWFKQPDLKTTKKISILAATFSGNKGAASMLESIIDNVSSNVSDIGFDVLSVYPEDDLMQNPYGNVRIVSCKAKQIVFQAFPLSMLYFVFHRFAPIKKLLLKNKILDSFYNCDFVVDAAGISFVDSRKLIMNFYNYICMFVPIALNKKVIKFSQAMGPFNKFSNRHLAKNILPKIDTICARGKITEEHLNKLGLNNVSLCADGAFVLPEDKNAIAKIKEICESQSFFEKKLIGLSISSVVYKYCVDIKIDYVKTMASFIDYLTSEKNYNVLIIAQSARQNKKSLKNNDLIICKKVYDMVENKKACMNLDIEMTPREIREFISKCELLVASRFHAMISSLYKNVPVFLIGWSHKYKEVLDMFELGECAGDYKLLEIELLKHNFEFFEKDAKNMRAKIKKNLPAVQKSTMKNIEIIIAKIKDIHNTIGDENEK